MKTKTKLFYYIDWANHSLPDNIEDTKAAIKYLERSLNDGSAVKGALYWINSYLEDLRLSLLELELLNE